MLETLSIVMFLIAGFYTIWVVIADDVNGHSTVNVLMLSTLNICIAFLCRDITFIVVCCAMKIVAILMIAAEYRLKDLKYTVNGKPVDENYILKHGDIITNCNFKGW